ncbi:hypothetical protein CWC46_10725 [Prodigiosinella confusarubida]|uniref:Uncharacterized protein n=1 Tax=Serratia sp. (strain ATCC 39006) TaxID=104623 RepID=A0A2I5T6S5_SERS3|nr:hypothetical protein CWC46_10725 [Serratia sp. ATCC 39006]AUH04556.1 hypothetical protein Ser39006_010730 [Serratia sp. ATCC 39006]
MRHPSFSIAYSLLFLREIYPSSFKLQRRCLASLTLVTYQRKFSGINSVATFLHFDIYLGIVMNAKALDNSQ